MQTRSEARTNNKMTTRSMANRATTFRELPPKKQKKLEFVVSKKRQIPKKKQLEETNVNESELEPKCFKIDFDDAHNEWMANKKRLGNGTYAYYCGHKLKNGKTCKNFCIDKLGLIGGCAKHYEGSLPLWFE